MSRRASGAQKAVAGSVPASGCNRWAPRWVISRETSLAGSPRSPKTACAILPDEDGEVRNSVMTAELRQRKQLADRLYQQHVKPMEREHAGEYVAVTADGQMVFGGTMVETARRARESFGPGSFLFKVGTKAVGKWR